MYLIVLELISNYFPEEGLSCARFKYLKITKQSVKCVWTQLTTCQKTSMKLEKGRETEESPVGRIVLDQLIENAEIADAEDRPYCQDTGMTLVFVEVGQDVHFVGGDLKEAINEGVAQGYVEGYLRKSVVAEPLFNRKNTQNNTPAIIYIDIVPGDKVEINVELKGFGSENKSDVAMLVPADGVEGVKNAVLEIVKHAWP